MPNSNSFEKLLKKSFETQNYPPIPTSILQKWQTNPLEKGAKWLWIVPGLVFMMGILVGVWLAPLGLSNAFEGMKLSFVAVLQSFPESTLTWALALALTMVILAIDSMRGWFRR